MEDVIKQFEFLEDELDCEDKKDFTIEEEESDSGTSETSFKVVTNEAGMQSNEDILLQLETLQNSVKEVNEMFYSNENSEIQCHNSDNTGIFYADLVFVQ